MLYVCGVCVYCVCGVCMCVVCVWCVCVWCVCGVCVVCVCGVCVCGVCVCGVFGGLAAFRLLKKKSSCKIRFHGERGPRTSPRSWAEGASLTVSSHQPLRLAWYHPQFLGEETAALSRGAQGHAAVVCWGQTWTRAPGPRVCPAALQTCASRA